MDNEALKAAWEAHKNQKRKGTDIPYIVHPLEVAVILIENGADNDMVTAGLLHDTIEDTDLTLEFIEKKFGKRVAGFVRAASEPDKINLKQKQTIEQKISSWKSRKQKTIEYLKTAAIDEKLVILADKLSNLRSMVENFKTSGNSLWGRFNSSCKDQMWYFKSLAESFSDLSNYDMYKEFKRLVHELFDSKEVEEYIKASGK